MPITASTLTTLAVFLPLTFVDGMAGRLFRDQSLAVVLSLAASLLVALTAVPTLLAHGQDSSPPPTRIWLARALAIYEGLLAWSLPRRNRVLVASLVVLAGTAVIALQLPRGVLPNETHSRLELHLTWPPGTDLDRLQQDSRPLEAELHRARGVGHVLADLGERDDAQLELTPRQPYEGRLTLVLEEPASLEEGRSLLASIPWPDGVSAELQPPPSPLETLLNSSGADLVLDLEAPRSRPRRAAVEAFRDHLADRPELIDVRLAAPAGIPAYRLHFHRDEAARLGVSSSGVEQALETAASGLLATRLEKTVDREVPVKLRFHGEETVGALLAQPVQAAAGMIPLGSVVSAEQRDLAATLFRDQQRPVVRLLADLSDGSDLAAARQAVAEAAAVLPPEVRVRLDGAVRSFDEALRASGKSLLLSTLLVFLILAAQFESFRQPLIVLAAVPLALVGATLGLALTGHGWNLMSLIGCVVLVGIVVNDAIVKVDRINHLRRRGDPLDRAIVDAGRDRFRPILMTTCTTCLGLLPMALGLGEGGRLRAPLAMAVIGGLITATALTLVVIPAIYRTLEGRREHRRS